MKNEDESSSQDEGFYKPSQLKVEDQPMEECQPLFLQRSETGSANELITQNRPTDYQPRILSSFHQFMQHQHYLRPCHEEVNSWSTIPLEELTQIRRQKIKKSRYLTLQQKYSNNEAYQCVYSKLQGTESHNSAYIFSINQTTDYNSKDYQTASFSQSNPSNSPFQSRFQSGNLFLAYKSLKSSQEEYDLILQNDTNTRGYNSWFFFSFKNGSSTTVRFNIVNLIKKHTLFQQGVRPVGLSTTNPTKGWHSVGSQLDYQKSYIVREILAKSPTTKNYYTLSFTVQFQHQDDTFYIAMNYPYTYTRMMNFIDRLGIHRLDLIIEKSILCYSLSNNAVPVLKIKHQEYAGNGKKIVVMGRQHPGQTVGSFVLEGFLKKIINEVDLLKQYEVIAIPMVNPDGVIYGNFRTNLSGFDLNRQWLAPDRWMHPEIYSISKYLQNLTGIAFLMDFHGHSKKYNSFIYACTGDPSYLYKVYPYIYSKTSKLFSIKDCTYNLTPDKERTARIQIYRAINRPQVFTLETSFFGYETQTGQKYRFKMHDLSEIGEGAALSLTTYLLRKKDLAMFEKEVKQKQYLFEQWTRKIPQDDIESESNPSEDELTPVQRNQKVIATRSGKRSKGVSPSKKRSKKKRDSSILNITKMKLATEEKSQGLLDRKSPQKKQQNMATVIVSKKKVGSQRVIPLAQGKINSRKVEKAVSLISSPLPPSKPKPKPLTKPQGPSFSNPSNKKIHLQFEKLQYEDKKLEEAYNTQKEKPKTITSNLFNKPNYFSHFQEKVFKKEAEQAHNKTQSLEISSIRREQTFSHGMDLLKKLISAEEEEKQIRWEQNQRHRDKLYMIRQNKIISSTARLNQEAMKKNLEEELANRTQALMNCQKKMNEITLDDPFLRSQTDNSAMEYLSNQLRQTCLVRGPKFPLIKGEKKHDYFNF